MARYWSALDILNQAAAELGLTKIVSITADGSVQTQQLLALANSAGNELLLYYPWEQFRKEWTFVTVPDVGEYELPDDWGYMLDQTQWDRSNHWPLLGPKSPQEWAWLKGGLLATAPRTRYRIYDNKFHLWPVPSVEETPTGLTLSQEYTSCMWVQPDAEGSPIPTDMIQSGSDTVLYDPWLMVKYIKLKFYDLKGFESAGVQSDFMRVFNALTGKDVGAPILNLAPRPLSQYLGPWSVPDGSWSVGQP